VTAMGLFSRVLKRSRDAPAPGGSGGRDEYESPRRVLFLDDDPARAEVFLAENPHAVWVQTVADCVARLGEEWDEIHLDHDLGGEHFVDDARADCGMEVVRWLCLESRPHLRRTQFLVHSHNPLAATMMAMELMTAGYLVELRPFGAPPLPPLPQEFQEPSGNPLRAVLSWLRRRLGLDPAWDQDDPTAPRSEDPRCDEPPFERPPRAADPPPPETRS